MNPRNRLLSNFFRLDLMLVFLLFSPILGRAETTWVSLGLVGEAISVILIDPDNPQILYAASHGVSGTGGVFRSTNGGVSWTLGGDLGIRGFLVELVMDPSNPQVLYAGTFFAPTPGASKSSNGGANWTPVVTGLSNREVKSLAVDPATPQTLYAATEGGVFKSTNGAGNWSAMRTGLTNMDMSSLAINPSNPQTLYTGTFGGGIFKTTNAGASWSAINTGLTQLVIYALVIDSSNPQIIYAGTADGGLFKSSNAGANWSASNTGLPDSDLSALAIDPSSPQTLYAATFDAGVFKSTDSGSTWSPFNTGLTDLQVLSLTIDPSNPSTVYAGASGPGATDGGIFKCVSEASVPVVLTQMFNVANADSAAVLQNLSATEQEIDVQFFSQDGEPLDLVTTLVPGLGEAQVSTPSGASGFQGSAVISGTAPLAARGQWNFNVGGSPVAVGVPAIPMNQISTTYHIPIGTVGPNSLVGVAIANPGDSTINCTAAYRNASGQPISQDLFTIPASGQAAQFVSGLAAGFEGSGTVQCDGDAAVVAVIQELVNGFPTILFAVSG